MWAPRVARGSGAARAALALCVLALARLASSADPIGAVRGNPPLIYLPRPTVLSTTAATELRGRAAPLGASLSVLASDKMPRSVLKTPMGPPPGDASNRVMSRVQLACDGARVPRLRSACASDDPGSAP